MGREGVDGGEVGVAVESFTQPSRYDELVISTQVPCTPGASEVQVHSTPVVYTPDNTTVSIVLLGCHSVGSSNLRVYTPALYI